MVCSFLVTITLLVAGPTKEKTQGTLKVKQYRYVDFSKASLKVRENILYVGAGTLQNEYPKVTGVELQQIDKLKCNFDGEEYQ